MIHTKNLTKVYQAGSQAVQALKGINLNVNKGEFISIMGPRNTAFENVMLPLKYAGLEKNDAKKKTEKVIDLVGLSSRSNHTPAELSGGQQQRVAIARALVNKPSILFADEPTGNLDSKTGQDVMKIFKELNELGQTIILITHENDIARQSNRIITIMDGLIESDTN